MRYYTFEPIDKPMLWGGRQLATLLGRAFPDAHARIGEAWDLVDRPQDQSRVMNSAETLHDLWTGPDRMSIFGRRAPDAERFPILIKLIDAAENLSIQVHPPRAIAEKRGYESKDEVWYFLHAQKDACVYAGFRERMTQEELRHALSSGTAAACLHRLPTMPDEAMFIPAGRVHSIGGGNLLLEVQTSGDTTLRLDDWGRVDASGHPRALQTEEALACVDFDDVRPTFIQPHGARIIATPHFELRRLWLDAHQSFEQPMDADSFEYWFVARGSVSFEGRSWRMGEAALIAASAGSVQVQTEGEPAVILRVRWS